MMKTCDSKEMGNTLRRTNSLRRTLVVEDNDDTATDNAKNRAVSQCCGNG